MNRIALISSALLLGTSAASVRADDWPQWGRQSLRNMYGAAKGLPDSFGKVGFKPGTEEIDPKEAKNLKWSAKIGSQSYGNVTVAQGKVFIGTNNENPRDPRHQGDRSILMCFDEKTGEFLWQLVVPKLASGKVNDWENLGLLSAPTVEGDRVYLVTTTARSRTKRSMSSKTFCLTAASPPNVPLRLSNPARKMRISFGVTT